MNFYWRKFIHNYLVLTSSINSVNDSFFFFALIVLFNTVPIVAVSLETSVNSVGSKIVVLDPFDTSINAWNDLIFIASVVGLEELIRLIDCLTPSAFNIAAAFLPSAIKIAEVLLPSAIKFAVFFLFQHAFAFPLLFLYQLAAKYF